MRPTTNLKAELEIAKTELRQLERKKARLEKQAAPSGGNSETSYVDADAIRADHHREAFSLLQEYNLTIVQIKATRDEIESLERDHAHVLEVAKHLNNTEAQVLCLRDIEGYSLKEIADKINLSYGRVRNIASEMDKKLKS